MSSPDGWRPRLYIDLTEEQYFALQKLFPWGVQQQFWRTVVDDVISLVSAKGEFAIAAVIASAVRPKEVLKTLSRIDKMEVPTNASPGPSNEVSERDD